MFDPFLGRDWRDGAAEHGREEVLVGSLVKSGGWRGVKLLLMFDLLLISFDVVGI